MMDSDEFDVNESVNLLDYGFAWNCLIPTTFKFGFELLTIPTGNKQCKQESTHLQPVCTSTSRSSMCCEPMTTSDSTLTWLVNNSMLSVRSVTDRQTDGRTDTEQCVPRHHRARRHAAGRRAVIRRPRQTALSHDWASAGRCRHWTDAARGSQWTAAPGPAQRSVPPAWKWSAPGSLQAGLCSSYKHSKSPRAASYISRQRGTARICCGRLTKKARWPQSRRKKFPEFSRLFQIHKLTFT